MHDGANTPDEPEYLLATDFPTRNTLFAPDDKTWVGEFEYNGDTVSAVPDSELDRATLSASTAAAGIRLWHASINNLRVAEPPKCLPEEFHEIMWKQFNWAKDYRPAGIIFAIGHADITSKFVGPHRVSYTDDYLELVRCLYELTFYFV